MQTGCVNQLQNISCDDIFVEKKKLSQKGCEDKITPM